MMIQELTLQFFAGTVNTPVKVAPACNSNVSPQAALFKADCRLPPALTLSTAPGAGVSATALGTVTRGNSAGPS
jgi:hypothetical protein